MVLAVQSQPALSLSVGNYLILDGYEAVQESSTDEEGAVWPPPLSGPGLPATDPAQQPRPSSRKALSDGAVEALAPRWGAGEGACLEAQSPSACADARSQVLACIREIEAALEHLKVRAAAPGRGGRGGGARTGSGCRVIGAPSLL